MQAGRRFNVEIEPAFGWEDSLAADWRRPNARCAGVSVIDVPPVNRRRRTCAQKRQKVRTD